MDIDIRGRWSAVTEAMRVHAQRRLHFSLGRFATRIRRATVRVGDANGPRGGVDKVCRIHLDVAGLEEVVIEDVDRDFYAAVDRAAERAARTVGRQLSRGRAGYRRRPGRWIVSGAERAQLAAEESR